MFVGRRWGGFVVGVWLENQYVWLDGCDCCLEQMMKSGKEKWSNAAEKRKDGPTRNDQSGGGTVPVFVQSYSFKNGDGRLEENQDKEFKLGNRNTQTDPVVAHRGRLKHSHQTQGSSQLAGEALTLFLQQCFLVRGMHRNINWAISGCLFLLLRWTTQVRRLAETRLRGRDLSTVPQLGRTDTRLATPEVSLRNILWAPGRHVGRQQNMEF